MEAKDSALALSEKLEKIIAGIEGKSLTVPAALLLAIKEVQQGAGFTALNGVIAFSAIAYSVTMLFVHQSQFALLVTLEATVLTTEIELRDKGLDEANPVLRETFDGLKRRIKMTKRGSFAMAVASWAPVVCVLFAMWFGTPRAARQASPTAHPPATALPTNPGSADLQRFPSVSTPPAVPPASPAAKAQSTSTPASSKP